MGRRVKIGIIGTSWWTDMMYLPSLASHPDAELAAICGRRREPAEKLAEAYGIGAIYQDYRRLLAHDELDAVIIATPDDSHRGMTLAALDAGLHVLCEKPLALNAVDAREMYDRAVAKGVKHMVLFTWRSQPYMRYLKRLVEDGYIGRCHHMQAAFVGGYAHEPQYIWRFDGARSNGALGDLGSHLIDLFRHFVGEVKSVGADLHQAIDRTGFGGSTGRPVNDCGTVTLRGADGAQGMLHVSAAAAYGDRDMKLSIALYGDRGTLEAEHIFAGSESRIRIRGITDGMPAFESLTVPADLGDGFAADDLIAPFRSQSVGPRYFVDAIRDDLDIPMSFFDGLIAQEVVDAALTSDRERRWVDLD